MPQAITLSASRAVTPTVQRSGAICWGPFNRSATGRSAVLRKDILHLTARKAGIHNLPKSGGRKGRPQGCSLCSHRLRRLKPLTPTLSPAAHSAMPSMLPCCTSDLNRRSQKSKGGQRRALRAVPTSGVDGGHGRTTSHQCGDDSAALAHSTDFRSCWSTPRTGTPRRLRSP